MKSSEVDILTALEQALVATILLQQNRAFGAAIFDGANDLVRPSKVSYGSLYPTLERLEKKGFLTSETVDPEPGRGGRPRRYFSVTGAGAQALRASDELSRRISGRLSELWGFA